MDPARLRLDRWLCLCLVYSIAPGCAGRAAPASPTPQSAPEGPAEVSHVTIEPHRIGGERDIYPEQPEITAMTKTGRGTFGIVKLCIDDRGEPSRIQIVRSTGYGRYDLKIGAEMSKWRFKPILEDGKPVPVCTSVTFIYRPPRRK